MEYKIKGMKTRRRLSEKAKESDREGEKKAKNLQRRETSETYENVTR